MNLLFVNHYRKFKNWEWGRNYAIPKELVKAGHSVTQCIISDSEKFKIKSYQQDGINIIEFPDLLWGRLRSGWDLYCTLRRKLEFNKFKEHFDLIHAFETRPATIYPILSYLRKTPTPLIIDWNDWWGRGGLIKENRPIWYQFLFEKFETYYEESFRHFGNGHTVVSDGLKRRLNSLGIKDNILYMPNGCNPEYFKPRNKNEAREKLGLQLDIPVLCFTGFEVLGDLDLVLSSFRIVLQNYPNAKLILTGKKTKTTNKFVYINNLNSSILQTGYLSEDNLKNVIASSDMCLMPFRNKISNIGRFPGKLSEYLSMGKPVVSNNVGEVGKTLSQDSIGILADQTTEDFAEKIIYLIKNPVLKNNLGFKSRNYAKDNLSWQNITSSLISFYENIVSNFKK